MWQVGAGRAATFPGHVLCLPRAAWVSGGVKEAGWYIISPRFTILHRDALRQSPPLNQRSACVILH
ncbi:hypothetical protein [Chloroflexus sp.]|uniref:hypothetical protein n=1 Tax=Chloroflexus sp. TaxID=1904827 RepID=UPI002606DFBF|nr:hypothetical protein [uncultured Chloroflexus sp.]